MNANPWVTYISEERDKPSKRHLNYIELLQSINLEDYKRWKDINFPAPPENVF